MAWTDERLDDLSRRMDVGFDRVDRAIRDLRTEMRQDIGDLRGEIASLRTIIVRVGTGIVVSLAGLVAASGIGGF